MQKWIPGVHGQQGLNWDTALGNNMHNLYTLQHSGKALPLPRLPPCYDSE